VPTLIEHIAARLAYAHARRVYRRFIHTLEEPRPIQQRILQRLRDLVGRSDFGRHFGLPAVRTPADLKRAVPVISYEDLRPYVERVWAGDTGAMFSPGQMLVMFATSSGTTAKPKLVPVTQQFVRDYRRGWNTFGLKLLSDHPRAILRPILQSTGRYDASFSPAGVPAGAITGLLARTQKGIVRRFYVGRTEIAQLDDPRARYYLLMRLGIVRDVAFAITANPATLIQMARTADEESETLLRDVYEGAIAAKFVPSHSLRATLAAGLRPAPARAAELQRLRASLGTLRPRDYWNLTFLACWTGGSMGHYLQRLREWFGDLPVRDIGLLASEGRVTIPLEDDTPVGVLDLQSALFEFIPAEHAEAPDPETLTPQELEAGREYAVVLSNSTGLLRYRLGDIVRAHGHIGQAPLLEFLCRAGRVASVAGEKLTEHQAVAAVRAACRQLNVPEFDFVLAPCWGDPPYYRLTCEGVAPPTLATEIDAALATENDEYASRRKSRRLGMLTVRAVKGGSIAAMDSRLGAQRGSTAEQYKRPCLFTEPGADDRALRLSIQ
jgi:hypothetical protein